MSTGEQYSGGMRRTAQLFRGLFRQSRGSIVLFSSILFAIYTLPVLISFFSEGNFFYWAEGLGHNFNGFGFFMFILYMMIVPITLGVKHYGYMHKKRAVDLYHALPVKRSELYLASTGVASLILAVPVVINLGAIMVLQVASGNGAYTPDAFVNMLLWLVAGYVVMAITGLCAVHAGTAVDTALFSMAVNGAPTAIYLLNQLVRENMLYGFMMGETAYRWAARMTPIATMFVRELDTSFDSGVNTVATMGVWLCIGVALTAATVFFYRRRKSEDAELVGNYGPAQIVIRILVYYLGAILFGVIFDELFWSYDSHTYFPIGAGIGALITGIIGELILTRSPRQSFKRMPIILGAAAVAVVGFYIYNTTGFGFETYVPDPGSVTQVNINFDDGHRYIYNRSSRYASYDDPEVIQLITEIHRAQVTAYKNDPHVSRWNYTNYFTINYQMKNGTVVSRRYTDAYDEAARLMAQLAQTPGYVNKASEFFNFEASQIGNVTLMSPLMDAQSPAGLNAAQKAALLEAIRTDLMARDAKAMARGETDVLGIIEMRVSERDWDSIIPNLPDGIDMDDRAEVELWEYYNSGYDNFSFILYAGDSATLAFLRQNDLQDAIAYDYEDVTAVYLVSGESHYYYSQLLLDVNAEYGEQMHYAVENYFDAEGNYYYRSRVMPVDIDRLPELIARSRTAVINTDDFVLIAMGTEASEGRLGYRYLLRADLPKDLGDRFDDVTYGSYWEDSGWDSGAWERSADDDWFEDWDDDWYGNWVGDSEEVTIAPLGLFADGIPTADEFEAAVEALVAGDPAIKEKLARYRDMAA